MEWAKKTGRVQGAEQQELLEFARKTLEAAEKDGDIFKPAASKKRGAEEEPEEVPPLPKAESKKPAAPLVGALTHVSLCCLFTVVHPECYIVFLYSFSASPVHGIYRWRHELRSRSIVSLDEEPLRPLISAAQAAPWVLP